MQRKKTALAEHTGETALGLPASFGHSAAFFGLTAPAVE
jgi:hypothetical protein